MAEKTEIAVIGGGASGLTAAISAARAGADVLILEKAAVLGRKIIASGNGRCNITNQNVSPERYRGEKKFISSVLSKFSFRDAEDFFTGLGLELKIEDEGRAFPRAGKSQSVMQVIENELKRLDVKVRTGARVISAKKSSAGFELILKGGEKIFARRVILSCGGMASPQLGGCSDGYGLARSFGHSLTSLAPSIVPLCIKQKSVSRLKGIRLSANVCAIQNGKKLSHSVGEILFTDYGVSGPAILQISGETAGNLSSGKVFLEINLLPQFTLPKAKEFLSHRWAKNEGRPLKVFFAGLFEQAVSNLIMDILGADKNEITARPMPEKVFSAITRWELEVSSARPWSEAAVTAGGVPVSEINPQTLESLKCPGLYITGETLDVDGACGGFNLHFAWACGIIAGRCAADF
ncbi:MAG: NAD(P)/FAD-dependent oxidoreductase [Elusimicrobia bacterium]|nr:NAD(P)/FAD-dependent oxidoreductase [Elusimicrobiota bacterium]